MCVSTLLERLSAEPLTGQVFSPGTSEYQDRNSSYYSAFQNDLQPSYIVKPRNAQDVCNIIKIFRPALISGEVKLAVRGGGHTPFAGSSNIQDGITLDMSDLKGISISEDQSVATVGVGENWSDVYTALELHGLTTGGGRGGSVGVTGLILGGGLSFYSTNRGFACDQVVEFEVVVASGEIVSASVQENPDLWLALRGGLNNFGIVTSFKMKTFKSGPIWGGTIFYQADKFPQLMSHACDFAVADKDPDTHMMYLIAYGYQQKIAMCRIYSTIGVENPPSMQNFTSMGSQIHEMNSLRKSTHQDFCDELTKDAIPGKRQLFMTLTVQVDAELTRAFYEAWENTVRMISDCEGIFLPFAYNILTRSLLQNSVEAGGNIMSLAPADGPLFVILIGPIWQSPNDDNKVISASTDLLEECKRLAEERGKLHPYLFPNYAYSTQNVFAGYGDGLAKMKEVSKKWDPEQVFQKGVPGGFKLV